MRKLRFCTTATAVAAFLIFGSCQKENIASDATAHLLTLSSQNTPSVILKNLGKNTTILPFDGQTAVDFSMQINDYQFFTTKAVHGRTAGDKPTDAPIFSIFYFDNAAGEQTVELSKSDLTNRLREVGVAQNDIVSITTRIFETAECSPTLLAETAARIAATLPSHLEGVYAAEVAKPQIFAPNMPNLAKKKARIDAIQLISKAELVPIEVKKVHRTLGVMGSLMTHGNSKAEIWLENGRYYAFDTQDIRAVFRQRLGDTEGDKLFIQLIWGELKEQSVWSIFSRTVLPNLPLTESTSERQLKRMFFRYNYIAIKDNVGRIGYTIYDMDGVSFEL